MAIRVDSSSPIRFNATGTPPFSQASASFTAPANSLLVLCANLNDSDGSAITSAVSDSGGLTWTQQVARLSTETTAGAESSIWTAVQTTSAARTVTLQWSGTATSPPRRISGKVYVVTGADLAGTPVDTVGASNEGGSLVNDMTTTAVTPGANGLLFVNDSEWQAGGVFDASSDLTQESQSWATEFSVCSGYKACVSGVAVTANLNGNTSAGVQHKWCQIVVRAAAEGAQTYPDASVWRRQATGRLDTTALLRDQTVDASALVASNEFFEFVPAGGGAYTLAVGSATFATATTAVALRAARRTAVTAVSYASTLTAVGLKVGRKAGVSSVSFLSTFTPISLRAVRKLPVSTVAFATTPTAVALRVARRLPVGSVAFSSAFSTVNLIYSPISGYTLSVASASYATSASGVTLRAIRRLPVAAAAFSSTFTPIRGIFGFSTFPTVGGSAPAPIIIND
jgi:hypothetical protein